MMRKMKIDSINICYYRIPEKENQELTNERLLGRRRREGEDLRVHVFFSRFLFMCIILRIPWTTN